MKRIVVLCDGTWNSPDIKDTTHLVELALALDTGDDQKVAYFSGVGVNDEKQFDNFLVRGINKYIGGATGLGLGTKVKSAYKFIAENYEKDDEIYLFGFSRGAFTARSVAGMIRKCGIIQDTTPRAIRKAFRLYRKTGDRNRPDSDKIQRKRIEMSPNFATSDAENRNRPHAVPIVNLAYVGVWDTVGARGIPKAVFGFVATLWNAQYQFHDMELSSLVKSARHAVASDEQRKFFVPSLWHNVSDLNQGANAADGQAPYQEKWFVGDHAIVGGSAELDGLSKYTLAWVAEGAPDLRFRSGAHPTTDGADHNTTTERLTNPGGLYEVAQNLMGWRQGPSLEAELHGSTKDRLRDDTSYRPGSLARFFSRFT
ncbi:MAG: DUF2235 domain-containing protein [Paracoccaceae bacterium]